MARQVLDVDDNLRKIQVNNLADPDKLKIQASQDRLLAKRAKVVFLPTIFLATKK